jgi:ATP-dependent Zn protease
MVTDGVILGLPLPAMVRVTTRGGTYVGKLPFAATKQIICDQIAVTLGGRAAESIILESVSDGAESDLVQATELVFRARYTCGLYANNLVSLNTVKLSQLDPFAPIGSVLNDDLKSHYLRTKGIVESNTKLIEHVAEALLEQREIDGDALAEVFLAYMIETDEQPTAAVGG